MGFVLCKQCKYQVYCTFPSSGKATECDEFEDIDTAESVEFDLQEFLRDWSPQGNQSPSDVDG